ncbi:MAG: OmpA family protein [Paludibacteraceae bacterium]|nr:OmpA family protein [Paludibacteraceae bacterium]
MTNIFHNILIASVVLSLTCTPVLVSAMPEPAPAAQTDKQKAAAAKAKAAEKKKKEAEKAKAAKEKEKAKAAAAKEKEKAKAAKEKEKAAAAKAKENEKKKAEAAKANEKAQAQREKEAAERAKIAAEREEAKAKKEAEAQAKEEKAIRDYEKYQESLENPKTEVISYVNLGARLGYAAMMDKFGSNTYLGAGTLNRSNALQQLKGGAGVGIDATYGLEYGHFRFETGLDFRFLNSASAYGFNATRTDVNYPGTKYLYLFDNLRETRNMFEIGVPVMFGAQFDRYYFLLGAKIHYGIPLGYSQKGRYDIIVNDPSLLEPYGMGIHDINGQTNAKIQFAQPDVSLAAEVGVDLDEWLQQSPDPKKKKQQTKPGQRLPFGREHIHYRAALFAEYGVLNTNSTPAALPVGFAADAVEVQHTNTLLAWGGDTKLNNLFVGAKFIVQFEIPGKKERPVPPPPAYAMYSIVDAETNQPLPLAFVETHNAETGKVTLREKQITPKGFRQKCALGSFVAEARAEGYYNTSFPFEIEEVGTTEYVTIALRHRPVLRVRVTNKETGLVVPASVQVRKRNTTETAYTLATDSVNGAASMMLEEGPQYTIHIAQIGYDTLDMEIAHIGDSMNIQLSPVKKGEVFVVRNLFFATNKTRILPTSEEALNDLYMYLARNPQVRIKIIGHTDNVGKDAANQKLSEGRAEAVMKDLIERGLTADRLQAEGRGETQPIDTNDTPEGRQNNRRVEIEIL